MLKKFFALTHTRSLYRVSDERNDLGWPTVEKIFDSGRSNLKIGQKLGHGQFVGVTPSGIVLYAADTDEDGFPQSLYDVNLKRWGGSTSEIVALFLDEAEAREALTASDLQPCDPRWYVQTRAVLTAIGRHPVFCVAPFHDPLPAA